MPDDPAPARPAEARAALPGSAEVSQPSSSGAAGSASAEGVAVVAPFVQSLADALRAFADSQRERHSAAAGASTSGERAHLAEPADESSVPANLEAFLAAVSLTGVHVYDWNDVKWLIRAKARSVGEAYRLAGDDCVAWPGCTYAEQMAMFEELLLVFDVTPFTIQRMCELLTAPTRHYRSTRKWLNALLKGVTVTTALPSADSFVVPATPISLAAPPSVPLDTLDGLVRAQRP